MKNNRRLLDVPLFCLLGLTCCAALAAAERNAGVPVVYAAPPDATTAIDPKAVPPTHNDKPVRLSAGLDEILKLNKSGVEESVILAFIESSPIAYYATADEIVTLRERGLSAPVLAALLRHGTEVRQREAAARAVEINSAPAPEATSTVNPPPVPEPVRVDSEATVYSAHSPAAIYSGYPGYYPYYPRYSGWWYPSFSLGIGFGGYGGHHGGTVHSSVGFHGGH